MYSAQAQPPQYDIAFILTANERIIFPNVYGAWGYDMSGLYHKLSRDRTLPTNTLFILYQRVRCPPDTNLLQVF